MTGSVPQRSAQLETLRSLLKQLGVQPEQLLTDPMRSPVVVPTFDEYVWQVAERDLDQAVPDVSDDRAWWLGACCNDAPNPDGGPASEQHASNRKIYSWDRLRPAMVVPGGEAYVERGGGVSIRLGHGASGGIRQFAGWVARGVWMPAVLGSAQIEVISAR
jgi:hypothetical protein